MTSIPLPDADADTAFFWEATEQRTLKILRCDACKTYIHYPRPVCRACGGTKLIPENVSGRGTIYSYTITHQAVPGYEPPFAVVLVELDEQPGLRMVSQLVDTPLDRIVIGMAVEVTFLPVAERVWLPMFKVAR